MGPQIAQKTIKFIFGPYFLQFIFYFGARMAQGIDFYRFLVNLLLIFRRFSLKSVLKSG